MADRPHSARRAAYFERLSAALPALTSQYAMRQAPHALLVSGPFGVGKASLAAQLAMALLCTGVDRPCHACPDCKKAQARTHPNLLVVAAAEKQRSVKVEQARTLLVSLSTHPFSPGPRVVLLQAVDIFTPQAQNALLKAIEEPDPATFFLLTCQNEQAVLSTIRSRCQTLRLPPWPEALVHELLLSQGLEKEETTRLSTLCMGSPGLALRIRGDAAFWAVKALCEDTLLSLSDYSQLPRASARLREEKDRAALVLDYAEAAAVRLLSDPGQGQPGQHRARSLLEGVLKARRQQASNLSWLAISDSLLIKILEETVPCPL